MQLIYKIYGYFRFLRDDFFLLAVLLNWISLTKTKTKMVCRNINIISLSLTKVVGKHYGRDKKFNIFYESNQFAWKWNKTTRLLKILKCSKLNKQIECNMTKALGFWTNVKKYGTLHKTLCILHQTHTQFAQTTDTHCVTKTLLCKYPASRIL